MLPLRRALLLFRNKACLRKLIKSQGNGKIKFLYGITGSGEKELLFTFFKNHLTMSGVSEKEIIDIELELFDVTKSAEAENEISKYIIPNTHQYVLLSGFMNLSDYYLLLFYFLDNPLLDVYIIVNDIGIDKILPYSIFEKIHVYPISFKEYYSSLADITVNDALNSYMKFGGLPEVIDQETVQEKREQLLSYIELYTFFQTVSPQTIYHDDMLKPLLKILATNFGEPLNPTLLAKLLKDNNEKSITNKTVNSYLNCLKDSNIIYQLERYNIAKNETSQASSIYFFEDIGLLNAFSNFEISDHSLKIRHIVFNYLNQKGFQIKSGSYSYLKKENKKVKRYNSDVTFVANDDSTYYFIQVTDDIANLETLSEDLANIRVNEDIKSKFDIKNIILLDKNINTFTDEKEVVIMSVTDFLLNENSLDL